MADISNVQTSFYGGEWSPYAQGQIDNPRYKVSMNKSRNGFPLSGGAWSRRVGFQLCGGTRRGMPGRTLQFNFTDLGEYRIELTDGWARIYFGVGLVYDTTSPVVSISQTTPAQVTLLNPMTWATDDTVEFSLAPVAGNKNSASAQSLLGRRYIVTRINANNFTLTDEITGAALDGTTVNFNAANVAITANHILEFQTPYMNGDWEGVRLIPAADVNPDGSSVAVLLHNNYPTQVVTATVPTTGNNLQGFTFGAATFYDGPYFDPPNNSAYANGATLTLTAGSGNDIDVALSDATAAGASGFQASDVGRFMRIFCQPPTYDPTVRYVPNNTVLYNGLYYISITTGTNNTPPANPLDWVPVDTSQAAIWVWGIIKSVADSTHCVMTAQEFFDGTLILPFTYVSNGTWTAMPTMSVWQMGLFSETTGYPACGCYYQGRLGLSGVKGNRVDFSYSNQLFLMAVSDEYDNVGQANAIAETFDSDTTNTIYFMKPNSQGVICGTKTAEWLVTAPTTGPLAPTNIASNQVTNLGCANILPATTPLTTIIIHKYQKEIYEYFPDVFTGKIVAPVLNEQAKHLMNANVQEIAYMSEPEPIIWGRCGDGSFFGCTYRRSTLYSSQPPDYAGFHGHTLGDGHTMTSLTIGPSSDGLNDSLYIVSQDPSTGHNFVSASRPILEEDQTLLNYWGVDTGIVPYGAVANATGITFYGLNGFDVGDKVSAFIGGLDCGDFTYEGGGSIFVPFGNNDANFTLAYLQSLGANVSYGDMTVALDNMTTTFPAVFGFTFTAQGQRLRGGVQPETGVANGPSVGTTQRTHMMGANVAVGVSGSVSFGTDFDDLEPAEFTKNEVTNVPTTTLYQGIFWDTTRAEYSFDDMLAWQMTRPLPFVLANIGVFKHGEAR